MKSVFGISDIIEVPHKRRRIETGELNSISSVFVMSTSEEGEKSAAALRGSMSPESCSEGEDSRTKVFSCSMCSYRTDRKNNLKRHTLTMHELSQALLECCNLRFLNKAELRMHTQKYHADGYYCEVCDRNFCRKALLKRHFSVHSGYKEFSCHYCGYETSHKSNLERHMRVHRKTSLPSEGAQHLSHGGFLPKLPTTCSSHLPPSIAFRSSLMSSQSHPILPSAQSHPTVFPLVVGQHPHLHPSLGSSWPVLHHAPLVPGMSFAMRVPEDSPSENPFRKLQQPFKTLPTTGDLKEEATSTTVTLKNKKGGPRRDFSVSALLGEDFLLEGHEDTEGGHPAQISSPQLPGIAQKDSQADLSLPKSSSASNLNHIPAKIQRPTPIHAHARPFHYSSVMPYASSPYFPGSIQTPTHPLPTLSFPRHSQPTEKGSQSSLSLPSPTIASSLTTVSLHAPSASLGNERPTEGDVQMAQSSSRRPSDSSKSPARRADDSSFSQNRFLDDPMTMPSIGSLSVTFPPPDNHLHMGLPLLAHPFPFHSPIHGPIRPHTPKNDLHDSGASSGYGSPGLEDSPRLKGHQGAADGSKKQIIHEEYKSFRRQSTTGGGVLCQREVSGEEQEEGDQGHEPMETDQEEYVPKKLRVSKKFQTAQ